MLSIGRILIKNKVTSSARYFYKTTNLQITKYEHFEKVPLAQQTAHLYEKYNDSILFSSFIENNKIKLGYTRNQMLKTLINKQNDRLQTNVRGSRPLSVAAQLLDTENKDTVSDVEIPLTNDLQINNIIVPNSKYVLDENELNFLTNVCNELADDKTKNQVPTNWFTDYETFDETTSTLADDNVYGTPNPRIPVSKIPCHGCGSLLHCADSSLPGYLPSELFQGKSNDLLTKITCQRCHFLKNYNTAINITVSPNDYIEMLKTIEDKFALVILLVDLMDFPCSIWPNITDIIGYKRPVFIVGNKVDLLPKDSKNYLNHIKMCLENSIIDAGIAKANIKHTCLISAETGFGVEELITKLHNVWLYKGDVYLIGCTNVGKSSLFNALLRSDYCKVKASNIIQKATASEWPGTTIRMLKFPILRPSDARVYVRAKRIISEKVKKMAEEKLRKDQAISTGRKQYATLIGHIGRSFSEISEKDEVMDAFKMSAKPPLNILTLDENSKEYRTSKWCFDTPGVVQPEQILNLLTTEELLLTIPKQMITPQTFLMKPGYTLFLAGLGRIDYVNGCSSIRFTVYSTPKLPKLICTTDMASNIYKDCLGSELLGVPMGNEERLKNWPALECVDFVGVEGDGEDCSCCDILLSSAGWIGLSIPRSETADFKVWTPEKRGIFMRKPSLIPFGVKLRGARVRRSLAYRVKNSFIKQ